MYPLCMSSPNIILIASRTRSQGHSAPNGYTEFQRVVQAKRTFDDNLTQVQRSSVRDLVAERHAKQIAQHLNAILGYGTRP